MIGKLQRAAEWVVETEAGPRPLVEAPDFPARMRDRARAEDPATTEYVVPVRWLRRRELHEAVKEPGLFASQVTVCKLRDENTISVLTRAFGLSDDDATSAAR